MPYEGPRRVSRVLPPPFTPAVLEAPAEAEQAREATKICTVDLGSATLKRSEHHDEVHPTPSSGLHRARSATQLAQERGRKCSAVPEEDPTSTDKDDIEDVKIKVATDESKGSSDQREFTPPKKDLAPMAPRDSPNAVVTSCLEFASPEESDDHVWNGKVANFPRAASSGASTTASAARKSSAPVRRSFSLRNAANTPVLTRRPSLLSCPAREPHRTPARLNFA
jgi:hypothetical protein